jgi:hypothetical protein
MPVEAPMPYELSFRKRVPIVDRDQYINDCCVGGDVVVDQLLSFVKARYADVDTGQEDWGWFIWFKQGAVKLAIDVFTDDAEAGEFRIHLTARTRRLLFDKVVDTPELDDLRSLVESNLGSWVGTPVTVSQIEPS